MRNLILIIAVLTVTLSTAQSVHFDWATKFNGNSFRIATDPNGNVMLTGNFSGTIDVDPGSSVYQLTSYGAEDAFFIKLDIDGNLIWANNLGGIGNDGVNDVSFDDQGDIYVAGYYSDSADLDMGSNEELFISEGTSDIFLLKMDGNGQFIWAQSIGGTAIVGVNEIAVGNSGTIYMTGFFNGTPDFDPGQPEYFLTSASSVFYTAKYNIDGSFLWAFQEGNFNNYFGCSVALDESENLYSTCQNGNQVVLQKRSPNGTLIWTNFLTSSSVIIGRSIATDNFGHILLTGVFRNSTDFDPGSAIVEYYGSLTDNTGFVEQLDTNGVFLWVNPLYTNISTDYYDVTTDLLGNVLLTGVYRSDCDFDVGPAIYLHTPSDISSNAFIQKIDSSGNFQWVKTIDGSSYEGGDRIANDAFGNVYITGLFQSLTDFDPGPNVFNLSASGNTWFVEKLSDCAPVTSINAITACSPYTWIDGVTYSTSSTSTFNYCSVKEDGCDSIVSLELTIVNSLNPVVISDNQTLTANTNNVNYQWIDCETNLALPGQTSQSFTPVENGNYAVITSFNGCIDTSSCVIIDQINVSELSKIFTEIYPNPSNGDFIIQGDATVDISEVNLISMDGRQLAFEMTQEAITSSEFRILCHMETCSKGIFLLQIHTKNQGIITHRIAID